MNLDLFSPVSNQAHAVPGALTFIGAQKQENTTFQLITYSETDSSFCCPVDLADTIERIHNHANTTTSSNDGDTSNQGTVIWLNVSGLHDIDNMRDISNHFGLHPLLMEDVLNTTQRPQLREMDGSIFAQFRMIRMDNSENIQSELVSFFLKGKLLITFQEHDGDVFDGVRTRIEKAQGRIRRKSADYLMFSLVDSVCDHCLQVLEHFGDQIEALESDVIHSSDATVLSRINETKSELIHFRRYTRPTRDAIQRWKNLEVESMQSGTEYYLEALSNLAARMHEQTDDYRTILSDQLAIYHSNLSSRLNDIMKLLTIYSVIFIPLTFIAGIYGTNFEYIPELKLRNGYFYMWGLMGFVTILLMLVFRKKKWL